MGRDLLSPSCSTHVTAAIEIGTAGDDVNVRGLALAMLPGVC